MSTMSHVTDTREWSIILTSMYNVNWYLVRESVKTQDKMNGRLNTIPSPELGLLHAKILIDEGVLRKV